MNNFTRLTINLFSVNPYTQWEMTKAKNRHKDVYFCCAICNIEKKLDCHHIIPVHIDSNLACEPTNFITLCRRCHYTFGHFGNWRKKWNPDIVIFSKETKLLYEDCVVRFLEQNKK